MRSSIRLLTTGIAFVVFGIIMTVMVAGDLIDNAKQPADYSTLEMEDFKEGMIVEGDLPYNYDSYETVTKEKNGRSEIVGFYYLIDAGEDGFMALYTPQKALIKQLDEQFKAYNNATTIAELNDIEPVHFRGKVTKMDNDDKRILKQYLSDYEGNKESIDLYIKVTDGMPVFLLPVGIVVVIVGLLFVFLFVRRKMMGR